MNESSEVRNVMVVVRKAPHGTIYVQEALEVMLIVAAYSMNISVVFLDDGVYALKKGQDTSELGSKPFMSAFRALVDWEIEHVYVDRDALKNRGINENELTEIGEDENTGEPVHPQVLSHKEIYKLMQEQHTILSF
ncbi:MAG: sulfurtransferase complex subunit TusC [Gammaproteobacteria bacterium]|nr:sulfurtransferase complex subunit TusC [Gammaproteobacteria bacterium]